MKKALKIVGIGIVIFIVGAMGALFVDYIIFTKMVAHPSWSQNPIIKELDNRVKVVKVIEKVIVADNESIAEIASRAAGTVAYIETINPDGDVKEGNGIIISSDGVIVTDNSIVSEEEGMFIFVKLASGEVYDVKETYFDKYTGLVFLRIDAQDLATTSFANSDDARSGKRLISISRSRFDNEARFALGGFFGHNHIFSIDSPMSDFLQGVLSIDFSQSILEQSVGAPVVDFHGNAVGLISIKQDKDTKENDFYAIAANDVYSAYESFLINSNIEPEETVNDEEVIKENILGIDYEEITDIDVYTQEYEISSGAIVVTPETYVQQSIFASTLAAKNGIRGGDIIVMVNNEVIDVKNNLSRLVNKYNGEELVLKVLRDGELVSITLVKSD